jgi:hypothetical protein
MKTLTSFTLAALATCSFALDATPAAALDTAAAFAEGWSWRATPYAWFPGVRSTTNVDVPGRGTLEVDVNPSDYLSDLQFAFMGTVEARKGPWTIIGDAVHFDFDMQNSAATSIYRPDGSAVPVSAEVRTDFKGFIGAIGAGYALMRTPTAQVDLVGGARYLRLKASVDYTIAGPQGSVLAADTVARSKDLWDGVIGLRGTTDLRGNWFVPYHVDLGTGSSRFTWQAFAGAGYKFGWGDVIVGYRHVAYDFRKDRPVSDLTLGGPVVGVAFSF